MIDFMKKPLVLLLLVCQLALSQNFSQILSGFVVPDGAQDFESVAESLGVTIPIDIYDTCRNYESYIWGDLKASTVNGLVRNLDGRIRQAHWQILVTDAESDFIVYAGQQNGTILSAGFGKGKVASGLYVLLILCEMR